MSEEKFDFSDIPKESAVYKIYNKDSGKIYVGSSVNVRKRWRDHLRKLRGSYHDNAHLQRAWNKYGETEFEFVILEEVEEGGNLVEREQFWIDKLNSFERGYNILQYAYSVSGYTHTEEAKRKMSEAHEGKKFSAETRKKMSEAKAGEKNPMYGKELSEKTRRKMSRARSGKNHPMYGKTLSEKTKRKMSKAQMGHKHSEKTRRKLSEMAKATWASRTRKRDEQRGQLRLFHNLDFGYES